MSVNGIGALERGYRRTPQRETLALLIDALALDDRQREAFENAARLRRPQRSSSVNVGSWSSGSATRFPLALTSFIGRQTELAEIPELVRRWRLVTITGAGGVGKTQMALQAAAASNGEDEAVSFVGFAPLTDPTLVTESIASAAAVQEVPNRSLLEALVASLKTKSLLLILDNCEHVIEEVATVVQALLAACPQVRILATSREPIAAAGEHVYRLPSLTVNDAITLFVDRARAIDARFELDDRSLPVVREICGRLDGIPLAIELAAAHVNVLSLSSVAEKLDDRFQILIGGRRTALPRQQTMRATIDWSYNMLSAQEQRVLEYLSVFVGGCSIASAIAVCTSDEIPENDVLELLASLIDKSLVMVDFEGREPRYWMLESFRQYARDQLAVRGEQQVAARRHALACLGLAEWFNRAFECEPVEIVRERGKHEGANWRAALHWSLTERGDVILGQRLAGQLGPYFSFVLSTARNTFFFGHLEGRRWIALALELVEARTPSSAFAALKHAEARIAGSLSEYERELELSHVALKHYRFLGDSLGIVRAQVTLAHALLYLGRRPEAGAVLESALPFGRELGSQCRFSVACLLRLFALATDDDVERARTYVEEALRIHRELGHESSIAYALLDSSECELAAGNVERALAHATEALASAPPANAFAECATAYRLSLCLAASRRYDEARDRARAALIPAREYRLDVYAAWILDQLATIEVLRTAPAPLGPDVAAAAARVFGFVGTRLAAAGSCRPAFAQPLHDRALAALRTALGSNLVAKLAIEGAAMSAEQAVREITERP